MEDKEINEALKNVLELVEMEQERKFVSNAELFDQLITAYSSQLDTQFIPTRVSQGYAGLNLGKLYEDNDLKLLIKSFKLNQLLDAFYALKIITDAKNKMASMPNIRECHITDPNEPGCIILGDLHGNFNDLCHIIDKFGIPGLNFKFVFNGDFVDRGEKQLEVLLTVLYAFLIRPDRVFINRGNHEDMSLNTSSHFQPNLMSTFVMRYGKYSAYLFSATVDMFSYMPLATILRNEVKPTSYFIVHGGISDDIDLTYLQSEVDRSKIKRISVTDAAMHRDVKMVSDLLWSDPITDARIIKFKFLKKNSGCYFNERRNVGCLFGLDVTDKFCRKNGIDVLIRSHEVRDKGYSEDHAKCLTIFSASHYCGGQNFGAVFRIEPNERQPVVYSYKTKPDLSVLAPESSTVKIARHNSQLIKQFKNLIRSRQTSLMGKFKEADEGKKGTLEISVWARILSHELNEEISPEHLITLKDFLCECESNLGVVNYETMFKQRNGKLIENPMDRNYLDIINNLFEILDKNGDKRISLSEAQEALLKINQKVGQNYSITEDCVNFIKNMDRNGDNFIDIDEFRRAFFEKDELTRHDEHLNSDDSEEGDLQIVRI